MQCYGVRMQVLLNVFPQRDAPVSIPPRLPISMEDPARLYWFSQTIGPGRGLEKILTVMARMQTPVELQLRGLASQHYVNSLEETARRLGVVQQVKILPLLSPDQIVREAAGADLGLSLEESKPLNRDLCLTNKIFAYLMAGIPQLMSTTTAQTAIAHELGDAAILGNFAQPQQVANTLDRFFSDPSRICDAMRRARDLARERFCWEREEDTFLRTFSQACS